MQEQSTDSRGKLAPVDFKAVKAQVSVLDVLQLMKWEKVKERGRELRGPCPVHGSSTPESTIFSVSPAKNAWHCFKCDASGNQLDLAGHYFGIPREESLRIAVSLCQELGLPIPRTEKRLC